jgi:hypothetical protein
MRVTFPHRHAFPGGRITIAEVGAAKGICVVAFSDDVAVIAECRPEGDAVYLTAPAYRTGRGTDAGPTELEARTRQRWHLAHAAIAVTAMVRPISAPELKLARFRLSEPFSARLIERCRDWRPRENRNL